MDQHITHQERPVTYQEIHVLHRDMGEMKALMSQIVEAINRIGLLDERQQVVQQALQKHIDRIERIEQKQQEADIARALASAGTERLSAIDIGLQELHIDRERDKARFSTVIWMIRGLWATVTVGGLGVVAKLWGGA